MLGSAMMLIPQIPGGILSDRLGRKQIILAGAILRLAPPMIFVLADNWLLFLPGIFMNSLALVDNPAWNALLVESISSEVRGTAYNTYRMVVSVSGIFTTPLGGILMDSIGVIHGTRICLVVNEALLLVYLLIIWRFVKEVKGRCHEEKMNLQVTTFQSLRKIPREIAVVTVSLGLCSFASGLSLSYTVIYASEVIGLTKTEWGILGTVVGLIATTLSIPSGVLSDRVGRRTCILASQFLWAVSTYLFINSPSFTLVLLARLLEGVGYGLGGLVSGFMGGPTWQALIADLAQERELGRVMGLIGTVTIAFNTSAPFIGGFLYDRYSPALPFQLNIITTIVAATIIFLSLRRRPEHLKH
jgi:MFS family permease